MQQLNSVWTALALRQRVIVLGATAAVILAVLGLARMASAPSMALLYAGLETGAAGDVVKALEGRGVVYEIRGSTIFVPDAERDSLRLTLASEGLPANSSQGYELLDGLSGFGTTSQMFDAAYWRAKEGELARTIVSNPAIATARVHIANGSANPFQRDVKPSASISVSTTSGSLSPQQARALRFLVASAVPGLEPDGVSVIDGNGGLIGAEAEGGAGQNAEDKAQQLRDRVQRLMEARVGPGNAVVEVSVETNTETESIVERRFDPESRVAISTDTEERSDNSKDGGGGDVTVASNLPDGGAASGGEGSASQTSEIRERVNYEVSETQREVTRAPGAIRRLTVAVLVNGTFVAGPEGTRVFEPLPEAELTGLRDLVASAVGFDEARGDVITLRSMPFDRPEGLGTGPIEPSLFSGVIDPMRLAQMGVLGVVVLILGLFVLRPILTRGAAPNDTAGFPALERPGGRVLDGELETEFGFESLPMATASGLSSTGGFERFDSPQEEDPVERLRGLIEERKSETVEILRNWLDEKETAK